MHRAKLALHIDTRHRLGHHFLLTHTYSACSVCIKEKPMSSVMSSFFFFFFFRNQGLWLPPIDANAPSTNPLSAVHNNSRCFCAAKDAISTGGVGTGSFRPFDSVRAGIFGWRRGTKEERIDQVDIIRSVSIISKGPVLFPLGVHGEMLHKRLD